jgi:hypothetical protein
LTLEYNIFKNQNRLENISSEKLQRYFQRRYQYDLELYRYFYELHQQNQIPEENIITLSYKSLCSELETSFKQIVDFTAIKPSPKLQQTIKQQTQKSYQRQHKIIDLQQFGLSKSQIERDFDFVFAAYNVDNSQLVVTD